MKQTIKQQLEAIRHNLREGIASYQDCADLASLADFIPLDDAELREASGRPEFVNAPHVVKTYRVTLQHDGGRIGITTSAGDITTAREIVCKSEGAPLSAVVKIEETTKQPRPHIVSYRHAIGYGANLRHTGRRRCYIVNASNKFDALQIVENYCGEWYSNHLQRGWLCSARMYRGAKMTRNMTDLRTIQEGARL